MQDQQPQHPIPLNTRVTHTCDKRTGTLICYTTDGLAHIKADNGVLWCTEPRHLTPSKGAWITVTNNGGRAWLRIADEVTA